MKEKIYEQLLKDMRLILSKDNKDITNYSLFLSLIKERLIDVSWIGFYFYDENYKILYLGMFQGLKACSKIKVGSGVCGTSFLMKSPLIVGDTSFFEGHIACDENSKSEIVLPLIKNNEIIGVLDLDSYKYNTFDEIDEKYLMKLIQILLNEEEM